MQSCIFLYFSFHSLILKITITEQTPEDGFEPPLEEPESSVLPLDDSGISIYIIHFFNYLAKKLIFCII